MARIKRYDIDPDKREEVYLRKLKNALSDDYIVHVQYPLRALSPPGTAPEFQRRIDFLIERPGHGIWVLDLKVWNPINILSVKNDVFEQFIPQEKITKRKEPYTQIEEYKAAIIDELRACKNELCSSHGGKGRSVNLYKGVIFSRWERSRFEQSFELSPEARRTTLFGSEAEPDRENPLKLPIALSTLPSSRVLIGAAMLEKTAVPDEESLPPPPPKPKPIQPKYSIPPHPWQPLSRHQAHPFAKGAAAAVFVIAAALITARHSPTQKPAPIAPVDPVNVVTPVEKPYHEHVKSTGLSVRKAPNKESERISALSEGDDVLVVGQTKSGWKDIKVVTQFGRPAVKKGIRGFVAESRLKR